MSDASVKCGEIVERVRGNTHRGIYGLGMWREELDGKGRVTLSCGPGPWPKYRLMPQEFRFSVMFTPLAK